MDIAEYKSRLKSGEKGGIYVFAGEEDYLIRYYLGELRAAINTDEAFAIFNNAVFDGEDVDFDALYEAVKSPPMMSDYKLIEWRHADISSMNEKEFDAFDRLVELSLEYPYSVIAFTAEGERLDFGTPKKPSKFIARFGKRINILRFDRSSENQLYGWLKKHFDALGTEVSLDALKALVFRSGRSMDVLAAEAEKLSYLAVSRGRRSVTAEDVGDICSTTLESDTFALSNAITDRNREAAFRALEDLKFRRVDPVIIFGMIARTYDEALTVAMLLEGGERLTDIEQLLKMNPYKLKIYAAAAKKYGAKALSDIVHLLSQTDADSKYGGVSGYVAIELFLSRAL